MGVLMPERVPVHNYRNLQAYKLLFPEAIDVAERAWRVSFRFERFELFDEVIRKAITSNTEAEWDCLFEIANDADFSVPVMEHMDWPDPSYLMGIPDNNGVRLNLFRQEVERSHPSRNHLHIN